MHHAKIPDTWESCLPVSSTILAAYHDVCRPGELRGGLWYEDFLSVSVFNLEVCKLAVNHDTATSPAVYPTCVCVCVCVCAWMEGDRRKNTACPKATLQLCRHCPLSKPTELFSWGERFTFGVVFRCYSQWQEQRSKHHGNWTSMTRD